MAEPPRLFSTTELPPAVAPKGNGARKTPTDVVLADTGENAGALVGKFVKWQTEVGYPPLTATQVARLGKQVKELIASGTARVHIVWALACWAEKSTQYVNISPGILDSYARVHAAAAAKAAGVERHSEEREQIQAELVAVDRITSKRNQRDQQNIETIKRRRERKRNQR